MPLRLALPPGRIEIKGTRDVRPTLASAHVPNEVSGMWDVDIASLRYVLDPAAADSVGKPNFLRPGNPYPFDGNLSTSGPWVQDGSGVVIDADAGVDMGVNDYYIVMWKIHMNAAFGNHWTEAYVYASTDMTNWEQLWYKRVVGPFNAVVYGSLTVPRQYRAFKTMMASNAGTYGGMRTYELGVYRYRLLV